MPKKKAPIAPPVASPVAQLQVNYLPLRQVTGYARNAKLHPQSQIDALKKSIQTFGFNNPILVDKTGTIVAGHGRYEAARQLGMPTVPTICLGHLTDEQRQAYVIADNRIAEMGDYDEELLAAEIAKISGFGIDVGSMGFDESEVADALAAAANGGFDLVENFGDEVEDINELKDDLRFPLEGEWELPKLRTDMQLEIPDSISLWTYRRITEGMQLPPPYLYNYRMDSSVGLDWKQTIVSFYTEDYRFECFWDTPGKSVGDLVKKGVLGCVIPNFTTAPDVSTTLRAYMTYRARYVGRYMQEAGLKIIPDINAFWYQPEFERVIKGLKGFRTISFQAHQNIVGVQRARFSEAIVYAMDELKPDTVLLYAPQEALTSYPALLRARVVRVEPNMKLKAQYKRMLDKRDKEQEQED